MKDTMTIAEMTHYLGSREVPEDFTDFWEKELLDVKALPDFKLQLRDFAVRGTVCYELSFQGSNGSQIYAKLLLPQKKQRVPVIFHFHGYQGRSSDWSDYFKYVLAGYGVAALDVRGQAGKSEDRGVFTGVTVKGQVIRGMTSGPQHLFYKDVYLDVYTLIEIVAGLAAVDAENLAVLGASQGGALALVGAALNRRIKKVVAIYPFLSDFPRILALGQPTEPYDELFRYFKFVDPLYRRGEEMLATLDYIDVKNFAHMIQGEVKLVTGLQDEICPPSTQYAVFNRLRTRKEQLLLPEYGHEPLNTVIGDLTMNWLTETKIEEG